MKILITGGAGFIGSNFCRLVAEARPHYKMTVVDKLTYAGNLRNLETVPKTQFDFYALDIASKEVADLIRGFDVVVNFAAESHVDRSIESSAEFVQTNVN